MLQTDLLQGDYVLSESTLALVYSCIGSLKNKIEMPDRVSSTLIKLELNNEEKRNFR